MNEYDRLSRMRRTWGLDASRGPMQTSNRNFVCVPNSARFCNITQSVGLVAVTSLAAELSANRMRSPGCRRRRRNNQSWNRLDAWHTLVYIHTRIIKSQIAFMCSSSVGLHTSTSRQLSVGQLWQRLDGIWRPLLLVQTFFPRSFWQRFNGMSTCGRILGLDTFWRRERIHLPTHVTK